jgi:uncharacterized protein YjbJ (UPF0337 family)
MNETQNLHLAQESTASLFVQTPIKHGLFVLACWLHVSAQRATDMKDSTKDQVSGKMHEVKGKVIEKTGKMTNDPDMEARGQDEKVAGKIQKKVGQIEKVFEK